ncbi:hypothetical protein ACERIT_13705 [Halopenitus sp. H-Gu1]|uniref:DUF7124 domain-containing protein n=1 Tax=Halopenitus sp. H-Gu1 TaxID=3242697 RepID=UPI00359DAFED
MTDRIDIDELDIDTDEETDHTEKAWLESDANTEAEGSTSGKRTAETDEGAAEDENTNTTSRAIPHVPRKNEDRPAGIPVESGGAGAGTSAERGAARSKPSESTTDEDGSRGGVAEPSGGPHGGGADDITLALTYGAMKRLEDPRLASADANQWADWIGVVGDVQAPVLTGFQREHGLDLDFFNGGGMEPAERLADIDEHSMFYAERMILVGETEAEKRIANTAGWEFIPLEEAAKKADWSLSENSES